MMHLDHFITWYFLIWKVSWDMHTPKGIQLNVKQPKWVSKVVKDVTAKINSLLLLN